MKATHLLILTVIFFAADINAQNKYFEKTYSWGRIQDGLNILLDSNQNYFLTCPYFRFDADTGSVATLKLDDNGNTSFLSKHIETEAETTVKATIKNDIGYLLLGFTRDFETNTINYPYSLQVDDDGNYISSQILSSNEFESGYFSGFRTVDGGYLIGGTITPYLTSPLFLEPYIVKLDAFGQVQWSQIYDNYIANNWIEDMLPSEDGGAYLLLQTNYYVNGSDMALLRIDSLGNIVWEKNYDFNPYSDIPDATDQHDSPRSIIRTLDGGFLITALIDTTMVIVPQIDLYQYLSFGAAFKTDSLGNIEWITFEHCSHDALPTAACQLADSSYVLCGSRLFPVIPEDPIEQLDVELFKLDKNGHTLWTRYYGGEFNDYAFDMIPTPDGGFVMCGRKEYINYELDTGMAYVYVIKTNCMGLLTEPETAFAYEPLGDNQIMFTNQTLYAYPDSIDGGYYIWDYGDGSPPFICGQGYAPCSGNIVTHQYTASGIYPVTLTAIVCSDTSVVQAIVNTEGGGGSVGLPPGISPPDHLKGEKTLSVYPNPAQNSITFQRVSKSPSGDLGVEWDLGLNGAEEITITLYHLTGQVALQTVLVAGEASKTISVAHLPVGVYLGKWQAVDGSLAGFVKVAVVR